MDRGNFAHIQRIRKLSLSDNPLKTLKHNLFFDVILLKSVRLQNCELDNLPREIFSKLEQLIDLDISRNQLTSLYCRIFAANPVLANINCAHKNLTHLHKDLFATNIHLERVNFEGNNLKIIEVNFDNLQRLITLDFTGNDCIKTGYFFLSGKDGVTKQVQQVQGKINESCKEAEVPAETTEVALSEQISNGIRDFLQTL